MKDIKEKNKPIRQHHVPQVYLRNCCNEKEQISVLNKKNKKIFKTGIKVAGAENNFYTLDKHKDPYCWENRYAYQIEPLMGRILPKVLSSTNIFIPNGKIIINEDEKKIS